MEIARVFLDTPMFYQFQGLQEILRKNRIKPETLDEQEIIVFVNKAMTAFKVMVGPHYLVYHNNGRKRFPLEAIAHFGTFFNGKEIDFQAAARKALETKYHKLR